MCKNDLILSITKRGVCGSWIGRDQDRRRICKYSAVEGYLMNPLEAVHAAMRSKMCVYAVGLLGA